MRRRTDIQNFNEQKLRAPLGACIHFSVLDFLRQGYMSHARAHMVWKTFAYGEDHPICLKVQSLNSSLLIEMGLGWANFFLWDSVFVAVGAFHGMDVVRALGILECRVHGFDVYAAV